MDIKTIRNRVILFKENLWIIDDIRDGTLLMSKLESDIEIEVFELDWFKDFDFEQARLNAVDVMNQTRYYDEFLSKEKDNSVL